MIKVLTHGNQYRRKTCNMCGCVFEFEDEDIESTSCWYKGFKTNVKYVRCPECREVIYITEDV